MARRESLTDRREREQTLTALGGDTIATEIAEGIQEFVVPREGVSLFVSELTNIRASDPNVFVHLEEGIRTQREDGSFVLASSDQSVTIFVNAVLPETRTLFQTAVGKILNAIHPLETAVITNVA